MKRSSVFIIVIITMIATAVAEFAVLKMAISSRQELHRKELERAMARVEEQRNEMEMEQVKYRALTAAFRYRDEFLKSLPTEERNRYATTVHDSLSMHKDRYSLGFSVEDSDEPARRCYIHVHLHPDLSLMRVDHGSWVE